MRSVNCAKMLNVICIANFSGNKFYTPNINREDQN
jgi:hypothetical protein